jgi:cytosine deaminase
MGESTPRDDPHRAARLTALRREIEAHTGARPHDAWSRIAVCEAIEAAFEGNAAIGVLLVDPAGEIVARDHNRMFHPRFRSDFHAEMVLLTAFEDANHDADLVGYTLVTSLEPCEMCMIRIINSGVTNVLYVSPDLGKGGITGPNALAPHWARLAQHQNFAAADCDPRIAEIALEAFELVIGDVVANLMARR